MTSALNPEAGPDFMGGHPGYRFGSQPPAMPHRFAGQPPAMPHRAGQPLFGSPHRLANPPPAVPHPAGQPLVVPQTAGQPPALPHGFAIQPPVLPPTGGQPPVMPHTAGQPPVKPKVFYRAVFQPVHTYPSMPGYRGGPVKAKPTHARYLDVYGSSPYGISYAPSSYPYGSPYAPIMAPMYGAPSPYNPQPSRRNLFGSYFGQPGMGGMGGMDMGGMAMGKSGGINQSNSVTMRRQSEMLG